MRKLLVILACVFMLSSCSDLGADRLILGGNKPSNQLDNPQNNNQSSNDNVETGELDRPEKPGLGNDDRYPSAGDKRTSQSKDKDNSSSGSSKDKSSSEKDKRDKDKKDPDETPEPSDRDDKDSKDKKDKKDKSKNKNDKASEDDKVRGQGDNTNPEDPNRGDTPAANDKSKDENHPKNKNNGKATQEKKLVSRSIYLGDSHVKYLDVGLNNYNIKRTQKLIDDGNIISTVTKFDPNDNEITYFSGHTYNYKSVASLKKDSIVTITDAKGKGYKYKIVDFKKYRAGDVENDAPFIGGYHLMNLAGDGIGVESIVIQYCDENDIPVIFLGLPL